MLITVLLAIPLCCALLSALMRKPAIAAKITCAGHLLVLPAALLLANQALHKDVTLYGFFSVDALSAFFIVVTAVITFASSLYSIGYIDDDLREGIISPRKGTAYYILFNLFVEVMYLVTTLDNLGLMWVAIEMTTLSSAFLVGFYNRKTSIEAAWKYIIICSVGITLALFGTILFYYTASQHGGIHTLSWSTLTLVVSRLDPSILKVAFLFILVGYGTKAGLAPMHTWLPDAHSQALAPVSAMLSGVLLKTSIYAIIRFMVIVNRSIGPQFTGNLLMLFGLLSMGVAAGFVLVQKDVKRLLAYSSIEHIGIIAVGLGFGGTVGFYGALLHVFNHAVSKSFMFFGTGVIVRAYNTHTIKAIHGTARALPFAGIMTIAGAAALGGSPPFSVFVSEIIILIAGFTRGYYAASTFFLIFVAVVFGAFMFHFGRMTFGKKPENMAVRGTRLSAKMSMGLLFGAMALFGVMIPGPFAQLLTAAVRIVASY